MEVCSEHQTVVTDLAIIKNDLKYIKDKVCSHIQEGEEKGGFRDRLIVTEMEVKTIKKEIFLSAGQSKNIIRSSVNIIKILLFRSPVRKQSSELSPCLK